MQSINKRRNIFLIRCFLAYLFFNTSVYASCNKEDVAYYLDRGFDTDQVAALCSDKIQNNKSEEKYQSYSDEYAETQDEDYIKKMRIERQVFFKSSLGAQDVKLRKDKLIFNVFECARDGLAKPGSDFNKEGCATVRVVVKLSEVEVSEKVYKEKVIFGTKSILIKGNVTSTIINSNGMAGLDPYDAETLKKKIRARLGKHKGEALVPIKPGLNFSYAMETFKDIVRFHKQLANKNNSVKDLSGELEFSNNETKDQNEYIIEKKQDKLNFSNEESDNINGTIVFDDMQNSEKNEENRMPEIIFD
jgi:hypothetical protein